VNSVLGLGGEGQCHKSTFLSNDADAQLCIVGGVDKIWGENKNQNLITV
jgi:hypothetical protein